MYVFCKKIFVNFWSFFRSCQISVGLKLNIIWFRKIMFALITHVFWLRKRKKQCLKYVGYNLIIGINRLTGPLKKIKKSDVAKCFNFGEIKSCSNDNRIILYRTEMCSPLQNHC